MRPGADTVIVTVVPAGLTGKASIAAEGPWSCQGDLHEQADPGADRGTLRQEPVRYRGRDSRSAISCGERQGG